MSKILLCVVLILQLFLNVFLQFDMINVEDELRHDHTRGGKHTTYCGPTGLTQGDDVLKRVFSSKAGQLDLFNESVDALVISSKMRQYKSQFGHPSSVVRPMMLHELFN